MPFEFKLSFSAQFVEFDKYVTLLPRLLRRLMRETAAVYYNNLIGNIPVDTGFLAGSFDPIKQASGASATPSPPVARKRPGGQDVYTHFGNTHIVKNPTSGLQFVTKPEDVLTEITDGETRYRLIFYFNNEIRYYPINDIHGVRSRAGGRAPWRFTERATRAALAYLEANLPKVLPAAIQGSIKQQLISYRPGLPPQRIRVRSG